MKSTSAVSSRFCDGIESILYIGFLGAFIVSPLPLGSNRAWSSLGLSAMLFALLAGYLLILSYRSFRKAPGDRLGLSINFNVFWLLLVALWMWAQAVVKMPADLMEALSPVNHRIYLDAWRVLHPNLKNDVFPVSLEPGKTLDKALLSLACFAMVVLMHGLLKNRQRLLQFCYVILISGVFQAIYGTLMVLTGSEYLFFVPKESYIGNATGTFVNRNHLAGYLEMTLALGIGLLLGQRKAAAPVRRHWRSVLANVLQIILSPIAIVRCLLIVSVIGLLMTQSRMGNAAFFNSLLITSVIALISARKFRRPGFAAIVVSIVAVDILLLGTWFDLDKVINRLENTGLATESRDEVVQYIMAMLPDFWLMGTGAGTFAYIFPAYTQYISGFYDHAHNDYLELLVELGVIGCVPLAGFVIYGLLNGWSILRSRDSQLLSGMGFATVMGTISLLIHSSVDFNLQIPANILLFVALLALPSVTRQALVKR